jgi:hypothetical protein
MKQMTSSYKKYLYTAALERDIYIIELNPNAWSRPLRPRNMILLASGSRKLYILDETARKIHAFHAYILGCDKFK